jgi:hypothetical protein
MGVAYCRYIGLLGKKTMDRITSKIKYLVEYQVYTANEVPMRIQCKCLVSIYVFPEMKLRGLVISKAELVMFCLPISTFMYLSAIYTVYSQDRSAYLAVDRSWEYINRAKINKCRNWEQGRAVSFLGIHKSDFWCSVHGA